MVFFAQAPDWVDAEECHRCRVQFGVMTRKVGGAFLKVGRLAILWFSFRQCGLVYEPMHWPEFMLSVFLAPLSCLRTDLLWKMFIEILNHSKVWHREGSACVWAVLWAVEQVSIHTQSKVARHAWWLWHQLCRLVSSWRCCVCECTVFIFLCICSSSSLVPF